MGRGRVRLNDGIKNEKMRESWKGRMKEKRHKTTEKTGERRKEDRGVCI